MIKKSLRGILLFSLTLILSGFRWPLYKTDIQQGNRITAEQCAQLHLGMSKAEVKALLGTPLMPPASEHQWTYIDYYQWGTGKVECKRVDLTFEMDKVVHFSVSP
jgi:outer membrane protein assembly factor BamE